MRTGNQTNVSYGWEMLTSQRARLSRKEHLGSTEFEAHIPHVVIFLEEHVILHSPLLKLYVHTAPIDGDHLADTTGPQRGL